MNLIRPKAFVPVHGEYRHLHAHGELAKRMGVEDVHVLEDGDRITIDGETKGFREWCRHFGINNSTVWKRMKRGMSFEDAVTTPVT